MEKYRYMKISSNGNTTVFILDTTLKEERVIISKCVMREEYLAAEQVCFLEKEYDIYSNNKIAMMGGEFCANAACSYVTYLGMSDNLPFYTEFKMVGSTNVLKGWIENRNDNKAFIKLEIDASSFKYSNTTVEYNNDYIKLFQISINCILHVLIKYDGRYDSKELINYIIDKFLNNTGERAIAVTVWNENLLSILPLVYVKDTKTMVWEESCGSASIALGCYFAIEKNQNQVSVLQPSGEYVNVVVEQSDNNLKTVIYKSETKIISEGTVYI